MEEGFNCSTEVYHWGRALHHHIPVSYQVASTLQG